MQIKMEDCQMFENAADLSDIQDKLNTSSHQKLERNLRKSIANQKRVTGSFGNLDFATHNINNNGNGTVDD